jgi:hypothetical protein
MATEPIRVYQAALESGRQAVRSARGTGVSDPRKLEIVFYGMACFDSLQNGAGYRVLFPNGLEEGQEIPIHGAGLWVRDRQELATARWPWFAWRNDFFLGEPRPLTISGLAETTLDAGAMEGHVTKLRDCDPTFEISETPDAVMDMVVDRGTLSAQIVNEAGMLVVLWEVERQRGERVRFTLGDTFVEIPDSASQVFLVNAGSSSGMDDTHSHFQLYRKLSTEPQKPLPYQKPPNEPASKGLVLKEPTFGYGPTKAAPPPATPIGNLPAGGISKLVLTPDYHCSPVRR